MFKLHVFYVLVLDSVSPEFLFSPVNENLYEQDKLHLKCETSLAVYKTSTLKKDGQVLEAKITSNSELRVLEYEILSLNMSDTGGYECIGMLKQGGAKTLVRSIIVQSKYFF